MDKKYASVEIKLAIVETIKADVFSCDTSFNPVYSQYYSTIGQKNIMAIPPKTSTIEYGFHSGSKKSECGTHLAKSI
jgi:hypothetical protein